MGTGEAKGSQRGDREIAIKSSEDIARMRRAGQIVALTLERLAKAAVPGVATVELDRVAEGVIRSFGADATFYRLYGYPAHICVSVNDEVVHGIPGDRVLREGDIVSFDVGATVEGMIADGAISVGVQSISEEAAKLLEVTEKALMLGLAQARPGNRVQDISAAIQTHVEARGYQVVRELVGHGVGYAMHEAPQVPNFVSRGGDSSVVLEAGMTLAVEPMVNAGTRQVVQDDDGWTYRTRDGSLSAHFEHTIAVTEEGADILTLREFPGRMAGTASNA